MNSNFEHNDRHVKEMPITGEFYKLDVMKLSKDYDILLMELDFVKIDEKGNVVGFVQYDEVYQNYKRIKENSNLFFCLGRCEFTNMAKIIYPKEHGARFLFGRHFVYLSNKVINNYMKRAKF
jgi:hypothetical protein